MGNLKHMIAFVALLLGSTIAVADESYDPVFKGTFSGVSLDSAVDKNEDGNVGAHQEWTGKATHVGKFTFKGAGERLPWDGASLCPPSTEPYPTELRLVSYYHSGVLLAANGDQIHVVLADGPGSELCFNFIDFKSFHGTSHFRVVGGTGRFRGASGQFTASYRGNTIPDSGGISSASGFEGEFIGELITAE